MPIYTFKKEDGSQYEVVMSYKVLDEYKQNNPEDTIVIHASPLCYKVTTTQTGFREVLNKIHKSTAGSQLNKTTEI